MLSSKAGRVVLVVIVGMALANLWFTFARSLIPFEIDHVATRIEVRKEKHPGVDDVLILRLTPGSGGIVIDREVAEKLQPGDKVEKDAWSSEMSVTGEQGERVALETSRDFKRMVVAMSLLLLSAVIALRRGSPRPTG